MSIDDTAALLDLEEEIAAEYAGSEMSTDSPFYEFHLPENKKRNEENLLRLFTHPRNEICALVPSEHNASAASFTVLESSPGVPASTLDASNATPVRYDGLLRVLREAFYPSYNYEESISSSKKAKRKNKRKAAPSEPLSESQKKARNQEKRRQIARRCAIAKAKRERMKMETYNCSASGTDSPPPPSSPFLDDELNRQRGLRTGTIVDRELEIIANAEWNIEDCKDENMIGEGLVEYVIKLLKHRPHPYTLSVMRHRNLWKWKRLLPQFCVFSEELMLATAIDELVRLDSDNRLILVETKSGYDNYINLGNDNMQCECLSDVNNSPLNQHFLQVLFAILMLEKYWGVTVHEAYVVVVNTKGVNRYELPKLFMDRRHDIWDYLSVYRSSIIDSRRGRQLRQSQSKKKKKKPSTKTRTKKSRQKKATQRGLSDFRV